MTGRTGWVHVAGADEHPAAGGEGAADGGTYAGVFGFGAGTDRKIRDRKIGA